MLFSTSIAKCDLYILWSCVLNKPSEHSLRYFQTPKLILFVRANLTFDISMACNKFYIGRQRKIMTDLVYIKSVCVIKVYRLREGVIETCCGLLD